jgi:hypothetical protein
MAIVREILEAVHGYNNDNTLMVDSPKAMFFFSFSIYSPPVLSPPLLQ